MTKNALDIVQSFVDGRPLTEAMLKRAFNAIQTWANIEIKNRNQILLDLFSAGYNLDNDGVANLVKSIQDQALFPNKNILQYEFIDTAGNLSATIFNNIWWVGALTNAAATITNTLNGNLRIATTAGGVADGDVSYRFSAFDPLNSPSFESIITLDDTTTAEVRMGWRSVATPTADYAYFKFDSAVSAGNIYCSSRNDGGTAVNQDSLVDLAVGTAIKLRVELSGISKINFYINDTQVAQDNTSTIKYKTDFVPFFNVKNKTNEVRNLDIDYARMVQNRSV